MIFNKITWDLQILFYCCTYIVNDYKVLNLQHDNDNTVSLKIFSRDERKVLVCDGVGVGVASSQLANMKGVNDKYRLNKSHIYLLTLFRNSLIFFFFFLFLFLTSSLISTNQINSVYLSLLPSLQTPYILSQIRTSPVALLVHTSAMNDLIIYPPYQGYHSLFFLLLMLFNSYYILDWKFFYGIRSSVFMICFWILSVWELGSIYTQFDYGVIVDFYTISRDCCWLPCLQIVMDFIK